jgi:hypothetical protein
MSFFDVFKKIGHGVKVAAIAVAHGFENIFGAQASQDFGHAALDVLKSALGQIVVAEVSALAGVSDLSGAEKAAQAQAAILKQVQALGIDASKSIVNMLIELAVQFIKGNLEAIPHA